MAVRQIGKFVGFGRKRDLSAIPADGFRAADREFFQQSHGTTTVVSTVVGLAVLALIGWQLRWSFVASLDFSVILDYREALLKGALTTIEVTVVSVAVGSVLGLALAVLSQVRFAPLAWLIGAYVEIWRNVPMVVLLFWVHFGLPRLIGGISMSAEASGILAMSLQSSAYLTDIARTGIGAVPLGQWHAADVLGMPAWAKWRHIILPQAIKIVLPALANVLISFIKLSAILSILSVGELMSTATRVSDYSFKPIEVITFAGLVYFVLGGVLGSGARHLEKRARMPAA